MSEKKSLDYEVRLFSDVEKKCALEFYPRAGLL